MLLPKPRERMLGMVGALGLGLGASASGPACIIPDYCILIETDGTDWCVNVEDAMMWPIGHPELAELVRNEETGPPIGCRCMNDGEMQILDDRVPADTYAELVEDIEEAARYSCADSVPPGYDHNCLTVDDDLGPTFSTPYNGGKSFDCVGSCGYANDPPFGSCGPDPNPWACNGEGAGETGDTSGATETGTETDTGGEPEDPGSVINRRPMP